ncbi:MAG TPA: proline--tRNA ligase [Candidatus Deferrimicrobium sp.]|nr:proline--tRNA ligase [Candidatus Deferrimicrobium sp.]
MRVSQILIPTLREVPAEAEIVSHQLMFRAGFIRKAAAGIYTHLPLSTRVLQKINRIIREEMDAKGGQEVMLPIIQPAELWKETGRWSVYGDEMFRLKDRHQREFCLGPTHEEIVTDLVRGEIRSYKQLPLLLYQIQNKYRDERRPRFGLMRGREFIMKDLYSFDRDQDGCKESYQKMYDAYTRIFSRCGLTFRPVEADAGAIGGSGGTHEFMVLAESGEAAVVYCPECDYAANVEKAECKPETKATEEEITANQLVATPGAKTIEEVCKFLNIDSNRLIKTLVYRADDKLVVALVRGDRELNEIKLLNLLGEVVSLDLASAGDVKELCGSETGYVGPVGLKDVEIIADTEVTLLVNAVCGANQDGYHLTGVNPERDFQIHRVADLRMIETGEPCPKCGVSLVSARGIEVGQVFNLGTKYSEKLRATFLDENGKEQVMVMGCYGIGVTRTMAATIEQHNDQDGIIWPMAIAPFHVIVVPVNVKDEAVVQAAETLYKELNDMGVEVIIDDRNERPGVKFKDADLVGYPIRVTVGSKTLQEGNVEVKFRRDGRVEFIGVNEAAKYLQQSVQAALTL